MKNLNQGSRYSRWALAVGLLSIAGAAAAAEAEVDSAPAEEQAVEEIIVTAQRREQSLQDVPLSITALSSEKVSDSNVQTSQELDVLTPGLLTTTVNGSSQTFIRGVGSQSTVVGTESSVATYVDGVYIASVTGSIFALNNIERIEVLRGPQGTLFGRNATGGVIQIVTDKPQQEPTVRASASYGNYDTAIGTLYGSTGLSDNVAASVALYGHHQGDGFGENIFTGQELNYNREFATRGQLSIDPSEAVSILLSADYDRQRNDIGTNRQTLAGTRTVLGTGRVGGPFDGNYNFGVYARNKQWGTSADVGFDLGSTTLRSITAYRKYEWVNLYDQDATPTRIIDVVRDEASDTFQQEFILSGSTGRLDWTAGAFYFEMDAGISPISTAANGPSTTNVARFSDAKTKSYAGYLQGTYAVTDALNLTAGLRYTDDESTLDGTLVTLPGHPLGTGVTLATVTNAKLPTDKMTWRFAADYQASSDLLLYASASRGFKSGQFNLSSPTQIPTDPETLDAYEVGYKADLLDRRLRFNGSAFRYDYKDIQLVQVAPPPINIQTLNAAKARVNGAEFELVAVPDVETGRLELGTTFTLLDAKYKSFPNAPYFVPNPYTAPPDGVTCPTATSVAPGGNSACRADSSGFRMIRAPKWTFSMNVDYEVSVGPGDLQLNANFYHNDGFFWEPSNRVRQKPFNVVNTQIAYAPNNSSWRFRVFARNLTNELYYSSVSEQAVGDLATAASPRTYGIGFDFRWQ